MRRADDVTFESHSEGGRGCVAWSGGGGVSGGEFGGADAFCEAPIHDEDFAVFADHDVVGFDVSVDESLVVGEGECVAGFSEDG
ncbi:MAG: hypothetical protein RIS92_3158 [Verrucomicrobiota bacterium]